MADDRGVAADVFVSAAEDWPGLDRARRREVMAALVHRVEEPLEPRGGESAADAWQHRRWLAWGTLVVAAAVLWWRERRGA
jgi:hypothetical protein